MVSYAVGCQQYWPLRSNQKFTTLQGMICERRLDVFCHIVQVALQSSLNVSLTEPLPPDRRASSATILPPLDLADGVPHSWFLSRLVFLLKTRALPETEALSRAGLDHQTISKLRIRVAHILFDLTRLDTDGQLPRANLNEDVFGSSYTSSASDCIEHVKWAIQVLAGWYRAGSALPWQAVLQETLQQLVCISFSLTVMEIKASYRYKRDHKNQFPFCCHCSNICPMTLRRTLCRRFSPFSMM